MKLQVFKRFRPGLMLSAIAGVLFTGASAVAADRVVLTYGPFQAPINVSDLKEFAETGEKTKTISQIVGFSGVEEDTLRGLMTLEIGFDLVPFSCLICSPTGVELIKEMALTVRTHRRVENMAAIHAAMINAVSDDGKISFIDFLEKYPVPGLYVDVGNIPETVDRLQSLAGDVDKFLKDATKYGKGGCTVQEVDFPDPAPAPVRPTPPPPQPRPPVVPPPAPAPIPPVRGLW
ncbi:MAG: alpha/beta hydrolase [Microcoleaceae cyanobacterium]